MKKQEALKIVADTGPNGAKAKIKPHNPSDYHFVAGQWQAGTAAASTDDNWVVLALLKSRIEFDDGGAAKCNGGSLVMGAEGCFCSTHGNTHQFDHPTDGRVWYWDAD